MLMRSKIMAAAILAAAALGLGRSAYADSVTFGTYGTFTPAGTDTASNSNTDGSTSTLNATVDASNYLQLAFKGEPAGTPATSSPFPGTGTTLGNFTLTSAGSANFVTLPTGQDTFTVTVDQTAPVGGTNSSTQYTVSGTVTSGVDANADVYFTISLLNSSFSIDGETYYPTNLVTLDAADNYTAPLSAMLVGPAGASTPAPAAAVGGLALLGLLGATRMRKKFASA